MALPVCCNLLNVGSVFFRMGVRTFGQKDILVLQSILGPQNILLQKTIIRAGMKKGRNTIQKNQGGITIIFI